jgi:hypothetical protein
MLLKQLLQYLRTLMILNDLPQKMREQLQD